MLKTRIEFWSLSSSLIFLRTMDAYLTYIITPDLRFEANPLVMFWNQGWSALFLVNFFAVLLSILLLYFSIKYPSDSHPLEPDYTFQGFISHYLYNDKTSFHKIYFVPPYNKKVILSFCGFLFVRVLIGWSIIVVIHNLAILNSESYRHYVNSYKLWLYLYISLLPVTIYYFWKFFRIEYGIYLQSYTE